MAVVCFPRSRDELQVCRRGFTEALRRTEMLVEGVEGNPGGTGHVFFGQGMVDLSRTNARISP